METAKEIFLESEGDSYFIRNRHAETMDYSELKMKRFENIFNQACKSKDHQIKVLEIGCSSGFNLFYLFKKYGCKCYGIEPSKQAVELANEKIVKEKLLNDIYIYQGTSDDLKFEDESFDIVIFGFCLFWVDRRHLFKSVSEGDRVLKEKGFMLIEDFDTKFPYKRINKHNARVFTYKMNYSELFLANPQYFLVSKQSYSHFDENFNLDIQERINSVVLFKEDIDNSYIK